MAKYAKCANCFEDIDYGDIIVVNGQQCFCSEECFIEYHSGEILYEGVNPTYDDWFEDP